MSEHISLTVQEQTEALNLSAEQVAVVEAVSPEMTVERVEGGVKITVEDWKQQTEAVVYDGAKGDKGDTGETGPKGDKGDPGERGETGPAGPQGAQGETGATGPKGDKGEKGDTGETGAQGPKGETGDTGEPGQDGVSPTITVTDITGGHRVTITDATGAHSFDVMDGEDVGGAVQDVQVNGVSVLNNGVANISEAVNNGSYGVVKISSGNGIGRAANGYLYVVTSTDAQVKSGTNSARPISPLNQHLSTFYGLAKAAGDATQSASNNTVGNYTESAKSAISEMLSGSVSVSGTTPTINALPGVRYVCGEVTTLDIVTPATGIVDVVFTSGATPTVLTVTPPSGMTMRWANGFDPSALDADTVYEVNVMDGCLGVAGTWT